MAKRIGSLKEFELKGVGGINEGVSSKMSLHYIDFFGLLWVSGVWMKQGHLHLVGSLGGTLYCAWLDDMNPKGSYYA